MMTTLTTPGIVDGRRLRRENNQVRVLSAALELFGEGIISPTVGEVAERAAVSQRSVFRYFSDVDDLLRAAVEHAIGTDPELGLLPAELPGPLEERARLYCESRVALHRRLDPVARVARSRFAENPRIAEPLLAVSERLAEQTEAFFATELDRFAGDGPALRSAVEATTSFDALFALERRHLGDDPAESMTIGVVKLLT